MSNGVQTSGVASFGDILPARVDGIDVGDLLREIGEASASSSPVDLFGLCLRAQRVLGSPNLAGTGRRQTEE